MFQGLYTVTRQKKLTSLNCDRWLVWISLSLMSERAVLQCPTAPRPCRPPPFESVGVSVRV